MPQLRLKRRKPSVITLADRARDARQWREAAQFYRTALDRNPRNPPIWVQYGHVLKEAGQFAQAETAYRTAIDCDPTTGDTHLQLGRMLMIQGKSEEAQACFLRAFAIDPSLSHSLHELQTLGCTESFLAELRNWGRPDSSQVFHRPSVNGSGDAVRNKSETTPRTPPAGSRDDIRARIEASGLFDREAYLSLNGDVREAGGDAWEHFLDCGLEEARPFTNSAVVAKLLSRMDAQLKKARASFAAAANQAFTRTDNSKIATLFSQRGIRIGVYWNSEGNFFIREIADLLVWGLQALNIEAVLREETASMEEHFDLRVFVAPHEFYLLGRGKAWKHLAGAPNTVLYNTEQVQTHWFCLAFPLLLKAPLVLDINFQTAEILRQAGCNVVHFMPGHLPTSPYAQPYLDISDIELTKGYSFARQPYDWLERNTLDDRPIDLLFIGSHAPRRDKALFRLRDLTDSHRFVCVYTPQDAPLTEHGYSSTSTATNCALAQRAKIVLNIHRDWLGYFEWSRIVMQGFWQGACVVTDPTLPNPIFEPRVHYLEENVRQIGELIRWLLDTPAGREKLETTRMAAYRHATSLGSMNVGLAPALSAFNQLLAL